jgi:hypothetical protein
VSSGAICTRSTRSSFACSLRAAWVRTRRYCWSQRQVACAGWLRPGCHCRCVWALWLGRPRRFLWPVLPCRLRRFLIARPPSTIRVFPSVMTCKIHRGGALSAQDRGRRSWERGAPSGRATGTLRPRSLRACQNVSLWSWTFFSTTLQDTVPVPPRSGGTQHRPTPIVAFIHTPPKSGGGRRPSGSPWCSAHVPTGNTPGESPTPTSSGPLPASCGAPTPKASERASEPWRRGCGLRRKTALSTAHPAWGPGKSGNLHSGP